MRIVFGESDTIFSMIFGRNIKCTKFLRSETFAPSIHLLLVESNRTIVSEPRSSGISLREGI